MLKPDGVRKEGKKYDETCTTTLTHTKTINIIQFHCLLPNILTSNLAAHEKKKKCKISISNNIAEIKKLKTSAAYSRTNAELEIFT